MSPTQSRILVLASGSGTNFQALLDACNSGHLSASIVRLICDRQKAYVLERAKTAGIPSTYHNYISYKKRHPQTDEGTRAAREDYDAELAEMILADKPDIVICAGWMRIVSGRLLAPLSAAGIPVINLHPALPGSFAGTQAIERAHAAWREGKIDKTGVMIHHVILEVDEGEPILVREIPFVRGEDEDLEAFETKLHGVEWEAIVEGTRRAIEELERNKAG